MEPPGLDNGPRDDMQLAGVQTCDEVELLLGSHDLLEL